MPSTKAWENGRGRRIGEKKGIAPTIGGGEKRAKELGNHDLQETLSSSRAKG